jgi:AraC-like DNA-binding protein
LTDRATQIRPAPSAGVLRAMFGRTFEQYLTRYAALPREQMLAAAGVSSHPDANAWLNVSTVARMLDGAAVAARDPALGLGFACQLPCSAFANASRYFATVSTGASIWLDVDGGSGELHYGIHDPELELHAQNSELVFALLTRMIREATGDASWAPRELQLRHPRPASTAVQEAYFRCPLRFEQPHDVLVVRAPALRSSLRFCDRARLAQLHDEAARALPDVREVFADRVRSIVLATLRDGDVAIEHVADRLGTSKRTVQRRLLEQGRSFHDLVAEVRSITARRYVADASIPLTDAAARLGYSELSAFSRAFRRWTGESALEYRRRMRDPRN